MKKKLRSLVPGDKVLFTYLKQVGKVGEALEGLKEGTIKKVQKAGQLGARAMDCPMDEELYWIETEDCMYVKRKMELIPSGKIRADIKKKILSNTRKI